MHPHAHTLINSQFLDPYPDTIMKEKKVTRNLKAKFTTSLQAIILCQPDTLPSALHILFNPYKIVSIIVPILLMRKQK